jgi:hypothetical protein
MLSEETGETIRPIHVPVARIAGARCESEIGMPTGHHQKPRCLPLETASWPDFSLSLSNDLLHGVAYPFRLHGLFQTADIEGRTRKRT